MSLKLPQESKSNFENAPTGSHLAICYRFIDLGTQATTFKGVTKLKHQVMIGWEIPEEKMTDGRPFSIHKTFNFSSHENSGFRQTLESWRGMAFTNEDFGNFDMSNLLGKPAMISVVQTTSGGKTYSNMDSIMRIPKGITVPALTNETLYLSLDEDFNDEVFNKLSDKTRMKISDSPEYKKLKGIQSNEPDHGVGNGIAPDLDDEIPF